jgi:hypothetical protein
MPEKVSKIAFNELPNDVQQKIQQILEHRKEMLPAAKRYAAYIAVFSILAAGGTYAKEKSWRKAAGAAALTGAAYLSLPLVGLATHRRQYRLEEFSLYRALKRSKNQQVQSLLSSNPFVVVNWSGDLVGKRWNPKIGFVPVGRRRIPTPQNRKALAKFLRKSRRR